MQQKNKNHFRILCHYFTSIDHTNVSVLSLTFIKNWMKNLALHFLHSDKSSIMNK